MSALLTYAHYKNKTLVHINKVKNGIACNCSCPHCGKPVEAKNGGDIREHHFAHSSGNTCEYAYETTLHLLAKQVLLETKKIMLPFSDDEYYPSGLVTFSEVEEEKELDGLGIRPDAIGTMQNGETILIEFFVTHKVSGKKRNVILQNNLKCIEIDLNFVRMDMFLMSSFLTKNANHRKWITQAEERHVGNGQSSTSQRNPLHLKTIDFLKNKFENETIKIIMSKLPIGSRTFVRNTYDLKVLGYDVCEYPSYRKSFDLLLYQSANQNKGYIAISVRSKRRSSNYKPPMNHGVIDIIIPQEYEYDWFITQDAIMDHAACVELYGLKQLDLKSEIVQTISDYDNSVVFNTMYCMEKLHVYNNPSDEEIISNTSIENEVPF